VRQAISNANLRMPFRSAESQDKRWQLQSNDHLKIAETYNPLIVHYNHGAAVRMSDIAEVIDSVQDVRPV